MSGRVTHVALIALAFVPACNNSVGQQAGSTVLPEGVFTGTGTCLIRTTSPSGEQSEVDNIQTVTFEINERGVPLVQGAEIRVGRTVVLEGIQGTYTRVEPTQSGIVIHSDGSGSSNGVTFTGFSIATMSMVDGNSIEYELTGSSLDSAGFGYNTSCSVLLER